MGGGGSKREDAHFLLLKEGLLSTDNWTLSKAVAIMLARGVSERETLSILVEHMGKHIATGRGADDGGRQLALMVNGVKVARQYEPDDRPRELDPPQGRKPGLTTNPVSYETAPPEIRRGCIVSALSVSMRLSRPRCLRSARTGRGSPS